MQTNLPKDLLASPQGQTAEKIIRSCVHCGFCLSACPTYGLLGDELDSPRGRIYLIKQALEGNPVSKNSLEHLDRCLTCRSCETTCPSGVEYGHLVDIGREFIEQKSPRPWYQALFRHGLRKSLTTPWIFNLLIALSPWNKAKTNKTPHRRADTIETDSSSLNSVLLISGCVQPALAPNINITTKQVLHKLGFNTIETPQSQCCGAIDYHLSAIDSATKQVQLNIDAWTQHLDNGVEAIISNASGCGAMIKDYAHIMKDNPEYAVKAERIVKHTQDISEFLMKQDLAIFKQKTNRHIVFQSPCTLQHGQKLPGRVERILVDLGFKLSPVKDNHLCCGSAGTYSIFQPKISRKLRDNKLSALLKETPEVIVTANIGCLVHLQKGTKTPVKHWIELLL